MRKILKLIVVIVVICVISGCGRVSRTDYDKLVDENQRLLAELEAINATVDVKLTGSFSATVHGIIPDYYAEPQPRVVILNQFQSAPFLLCLENDILSMIEIDKTYCFEITDTPIGTISADEFAVGFYNVERGTYPLAGIKSVRLATDDEWGLNSPSLTYQKTDD